MKKIFCCMLSALLLITLSACNKKVEKSNASQFNFDTEAASEEGKDGWVYFFTYEYGRKSAENMKPEYHFNAYNLKYSYIKGYDIPVISESSGKVEQLINPKLPYISLNKKFSDDINNISTYFSKKQFKHTIELKDLDGLSLSAISKEQVLRLFNKAIEKGPMSDGKYGYLPEADLMKEEKELSGYQWQTAYFIAHGNIMNVRIELVSNGSVYLSDLCEKGKADKNQQEIYKKIKEIEREILKQQKFTVIDNNSAPTIGNINFSRLYTILQKIQSGERQS